MEGGPPCFPRGFTCPAVLWILPGVLSFRLHDSHILWCAFPCTSASSPQSLSQSATPGIFLSLVWPPPRSLATTCGISVDFFSSPYLDVSVQAVPPTYLCVQYAVIRRYSYRIAPFGYLRINVCLRLPAAFRSLPRPSSAPDAKAFALRPS